MAVNTVSTYSVFQSTLNDVSKVQSDLTTQQQQLSSGRKSQDFTGMAESTQQYLSIDSILARTNQYLNDNQVIESRINTTSGALDQVISLATSLQNLIAQRRSGVSNSAAFSPQLQGVWGQLANQLNTTVGNQFLFSGTKTSTPPIDPNQFPTTVYAGIPDDSYYKGSKQDLIARPQDNTTIIYNVRADSEGFQKLMAGLAMAKQADQSNSDADFAKAYTLVQDGLKETINTQAVVNANKVQFSTINANLSNSRLYWKGLQESIGNADLVSISTQVAINQSILQATFQSFAKINGLRLSDFLR